MKAVVDALDQVAEGLRDQYEQGPDGKYVLKLEGDHPAIQTAVSQANGQITELKGKVDNFRDTNVRLLKAVGAESIDGAISKLEALKAVDPDEYKRLKEKDANLVGKGVKNADDITALITKAVEAAVTPLNQRLDASEAARTAAEKAAQDEKLKGTLTQAGIAAGVQESALADFLARGTQKFTADGDQIVARNADGTPIFSQQTAGQPLTPEEWAASLQAEAPHLFKPDAGGGAGSTVKGGQGNPAGVKVLSPDQFGDNIEAIAKGDATIPVPWED